jgi:hypothetical protein
MISAAEQELAAAGVDASPEVVLADAGYWSNEHIDSLRERGIIPLVAADTTRDRPRKTRLGGPYDFMRRVMATEAGGGPIPNASAWSSPSLPRSRRTVGSIASNEEAGRPLARNGA